MPCAYKLYAIMKHLYGITKSMPRGVARGGGRWLHYLTFVLHQLVSMPCAHKLNCMITFLLGFEDYHWNLPDEILTLKNNNLIIKQ